MLNDQMDKLCNNQEVSVAALNTADAKDSSRVRSSHESDTFNVEDEKLRKRMEKSIADHDESHESMMVNEADMDFRIPGLPFRCETRAKYHGSTMDSEN